MFVLTVDQRDSRRGDDLVPAALKTIESAAGLALASMPERTAGDEVQAAVTDAAAALSIVLRLTRSNAWSVGLGVGATDHLADSVRASRGEAFVHARDAVERAKRSPQRLAVTGPESSLASIDAEAFARLLVDLRDRRTDEGWEVYDLLAQGLTQAEAASRLGVTAGAVSLRARAAGLRTEEAAVPSLIRALERADREAGGTAVPD